MSLTAGLVRALDMIEY